MMVVSEMGEQWSPHTAPAMQAETHTMASGLPLLRGNTLSTMGIRMPKVPQDVPVAKARKQPMRNTMAGSSIWNPAAECSTTAATYSRAPSESVMAFRLHAKVRIMMAGTMALKPSGMQAIISLKPIRRRIR